MSETKALRQGSYKATAPPWKETYRKRCLDRLRESRAKHHASRRNLDTTETMLISDKQEDTNKENICDVDTIDRIMKEELEIMREDTQRLKGDALNKNNSNVGDSVCHYECGFFYDDVDKRELDEILREIHKDLRIEEQLMMQEMCDEHYEIEEGELCDLLRSLDTSDVICPLCQKNRLFINKGVVLCKCGLRIDTAQDCINLKNIQGNLKDGTDEHSEFCVQKPTFSVREMCGVTNLIMSCEECDFLFIVI